MMILPSFLMSSKLRAWAVHSISAPARATAKPRATVLSSFMRACPFAGASLGCLSKQVPRHAPNPGIVLQVADEIALQTGQDHLDCNGGEHQTHQFFDG